MFKFKQFHVFNQIFLNFEQNWKYLLYIVVAFQVVHLYQKLLTGMRKPPPRWQFCAEVTHKFFGHLLNSLLHRWSSSTSIVLSLFTSMVVWSGSSWGNWERGSPRFRGSSPDFVRPSRLRYLLCTSFSTWRTSFTVSFPVYKLCASSLVLCFSFSLSSSLSFFSSLFSFLYIYM